MNDEFDAEVKEVLSVVHRVEALEKDNKSLRALFGARTTNYPFERGSTYFPAGDPIPTHGSPAESLDGIVYAFTDADRFSIACRLTKNRSGHSLTPNTNHNVVVKEQKDGKEVDKIVVSGNVDSKLRHHVAPGDFFYLEL